MGKVAILKLGQGSFERGFPVTLQVTGDDGKLLEGITEERHLSAAPEVFKAYRKWQLVHWQRVGVRLQHKEGEQVTNVSLEDLEEELRESLNKWLNLNSSEFGPVRDALMSNLNLEDEVRVIFQTDDDELRRIPWNLWEFFRRFHNAEGGVSPPNFQRIERTIPFRNKLRILAILGDSTGIDIKADRQFLENLPDAETKFLVEPKRSKISDQLWEQSWDILFFAGHSRSAAGGQKGFIHLNPDESLSISKLKNSLKTAIANGLELAIFNSCDGLGIARELEELNIPVTIVMREPVPDLVAQQFLKYFLRAYSGGKSLYLAVREARERLEWLSQDFPGASWLPVICQNPAIEPPSWQGLLQRHGDKLLELKDKKKDKYTSDFENIISDKKTIDDHSYKKSTDSELEQLLQQQNWEEASQKTFKLILKLVKREEHLCLGIEELRQFEFDDNFKNGINKINDLWMQFSNHKYSFTSQANIYKSIISQVYQYDEEIPEEISPERQAQIWDEFKKKVGWDSKTESSKKRVLEKFDRGYFPNPSSWSLKDQTETIMKFIFKVIEPQNLSQEED